jgi:hypothetical protein
MNATKKIWVLLLLALSFCMINGYAMTPQARLRMHLDLLYALSPQDSVLNVQAIRNDSLQIQVLKANSPSQAQGEYLGMKLPPTAVTQLSQLSQMAMLFPADSTNGPARNISATRKNLITYVIMQNIYANTMAMVSANIIADGGLSRTIRSALYFNAALQIPLHIWFGQKAQVTDAHVTATNFYSLAGYGSAYLLSGSFIANDSAAVTKGAWLGLAGYPIGLAYGLYRGAQLTHNPGRMQLESNLGVAGIYLGWLTAEQMHSHSSQTSYAVALGGLAAGIGGSYFYRPTEILPEGVGPGILLQTVMIRMLAHHSLFRESNNGKYSQEYGLGFAAVGLGVALFTHKNDHSTMERNFYNFLGASGGALLGLGVMAGGASSNYLVVTSSLGYWITYYATRNMQQHPAKQVSQKYSFNIVPQLWMSKQADGTYAKGWSIPGYKVRF